MISWSRVDQQGKTLNKNREKQTLKKKGVWYVKKKYVDKRNNFN